MRLTDDQIAYCMECGVCTGSCPISRNDSLFSPRLIIKQILVDQREAVLHGSDLWRCITCGRCSARCPALIDFPRFVQQSRQQARRRGKLPHPSHHGMFPLISRLQLQGHRQQRAAWAREHGRIREAGEVFYFVGCAPYFEVIFRYLSIQPLRTARSVLTLMNAVGVEPVVRDDEVCCGHDAHWTGDEEVFRRLAQRNLEVVEKSGAKKVVFSCPEGYLTFRDEYPKIFGKLPFEVVYVSDFLSERLDALAVRMDDRHGSPEVVTYHDPCRLGRFGGIYDSPRALLDGMPSVERVEMERSRENALCCGTSAWIECSACSKATQIERLEGAHETLALDVSRRLLITSCPKCYIHLNCARSTLPEGHPAASVEVEDLYCYMAQHLVKD